MAQATTPIAVTIAGSDSSGGAGIQADLKAFSALGVYGASVITALTAQNTQGVTAIHPVPSEFIKEQADAVFQDLTVSAVKIGMVPTAEMASTVAASLKTYSGPRVVFDPVMVATSGDILIDKGDVGSIVEALFPLADLITPNLQEAAFLLGKEIAGTEEEMIAQGHALRDLGARNVLMKGGHQVGKDAVDILITPERHQHFMSARVSTSNTHGTGCTLSSAIAAGFAKGLDMEETVTQAKTYVYEAIAAADQLAIGKGAGPVHHFFQWWTGSDT